MGSNRISIYNEEDYLDEDDEVLEVEPPADMRAYLKELYPSASEVELDDYLHLIRTFDSQKLPPTDNCKMFIERAETFNKVKAEKDSLRLKVLEEYQKLGHQIDLLSINPSSKRTFNQEGFYEWVSALDCMNPELLEELTIRIINVKKFMELVAKGKLTYDEIPDSIEKRSRPSYTVNVTEFRKGPRKSK